MNSERGIIAQGNLPEGPKGSKKVFSLFRFEASETALRLADSGTTKRDVFIEGQVRVRERVGDIRLVSCVLVGRVDPKQPGSVVKKPQCGGRAGSARPGFDVTTLTRGSCFLLHVARDSLKASQFSYNGVSIAHFIRKLGVKP